jgi:hypothetical protein
MHADENEIVNTILDDKDWIMIKRNSTTALYFPYVPMFCTAEQALFVIGIVDAL